MKGNNQSGNIITRNYILYRYDRTADITSRVKISQEMAQAINDELYEYEDELWDPSDDEAWVSRISLLIFIYFLLEFEPKFVETFFLSN